MDPELMRMLMLSGGGGYPTAMVPPPGMLGGMTAPQGFGDVPALPIPPAMVPTGLTTPANAAPMPQFLTTPGPARPAEPYMTDPMVAGSPPPPAPITQPATLGASLEPMVPTPRSRPAEAPGGSTPNASRGGSIADAKAFSDTLKSVVSPAAPQAQKVSTPHAPPMAKMAAGNVAELLASLGIGPQQAFPGLKLPSTLGQALGGR